MSERMEERSFYEAFSVSPRLRYKIVMTLLKNPGMTPTEIAESLPRENHENPENPDPKKRHKPYSRERVNAHMSELVRYGILERDTKSLRLDMRGVPYKVVGDAVVIDLLQKLDPESLKDAKRRNREMPM